MPRMVGAQDACCQVAWRARACTKMALAVPRHGAAPPACASAAVTLSIADSSDTPRCSIRALRGVPRIWPVAMVRALTPVTWMVRSSMHSSSNPVACSSSRSD